jgi:hypothetical protein
VTPLVYLLRIAMQAVHGWDEEVFAPSITLQETPVALRERQTDIAGSGLSFRNPHLSPSHPLRPAPNPESFWGNSFRGQRCCLICVAPFWFDKWYLSTIYSGDDSIAVLQRQLLGALTSSWSLQSPWLTLPNQKIAASRRRSPRLRWREDQIGI